MQIKLISLRLKNFKGIKEFSFIPEGRNVSVYGDNGTGKTSLFDAFLWLLFSKDSQGKADFAVKPLKEDGSPIHNIDVEVEAQLEVDGEKLSLKKIMKEKWTKKRGSVKATLTGHTFQYFIDGVPVKKKDWDSRLSELVNEEFFRLVTNPFYFPSLHWGKRRQILIDMFGDLSPQQVVEQDESLTPLLEILTKRSIQDHVKAVKSQQRDINKRLKEIPARIDELMATLPQEIANPEEIKQRIKEIEEEIKAVRSGDKIGELMNKKRELQKKLAKIEQEERKKIQAKEKELWQKVSELEKQCQQIKNEIEKIQDKNEWLNKQIEFKNKQLEELREQYKEIFNQQPDSKKNCPTCGQPFPQEKIKEVQEKFQAQKEKQLKEIKKQGQDIKKSVEIMEDEVKRNIETIKALQKQQEEIKKAYKEAQQQWEDFTHIDSLITSQEISNLHQQLEEIDQQIAKAQIQIDTSDLESQLEQERQKLAEIEAAKKINVRVEGLKKEEKTLVKEYEELEKELYLCEKFIVKKVELLEEKINSQFQMAKFKLFEQQINGGITECCEILYQGVPFDKGLNRGAQINVGLDIINTLAKHYNFVAPIFIDNAEAIVNIISTEGQQIKLYVKENQKTLTIKKEE